LNTFIVSVFPVSGLLIGWWLFSSFPWKQKPSTLVYVMTMLAYLSVCTGLGFLAGGWLAGQFGQIFAGS